MPIRFGVDTRAIRLINTHARIDAMRQFLADEMAKEGLSTPNGLTMDITAKETWSGADRLEIGVNDSQSSRRFAMDILWRGICDAKETTLPLIMGFLKQAETALTKLRDVPFSPP